MDTRTEHSPGTYAAGSTNQQVPPPRQADDLSVPQLLSQLTEQTAELVRSEVRLAQAELQTSVKHAGVGIGLLGGSGLLAFYAGGTLVAAAVLALALVLPAWLAALGVGAALLLLVGILAITGVGQVKQAPPPLRASADSVREDVRTVQEARRG